MRRILLLLLIFSSLMGRAAPTADQLAEFFLPALISDPRLSPNGEYLGFRVRNGDSFSVGIYTFATGHMEIVGNSSNLVVLDFWWKSPTRLLINSTSPKYDAVGWFAIDVDGKNLEDLWRLRQAPGTLIDALPDDPRHVLKQNGQEIMSVDLDSGTSKKLDGDIGWVREWVLDAKGRARAGSARDYDDTRRLWWRSGALGEWRLTKFAPGEKAFYPVGVDADGNSLLCWDYSQGGEVVVSRMDTQTGKREVIVRKSGFDPTHVLSLSRTRQPIAAAYGQGPEVQLVALSEALAPNVARLQKRFAGFFPIIFDNLNDGKTWLVWAGNSRLPGAFFIFNSQTAETKLVALTHDAALKEDRLAPAEFFAFPRRGGGNLTARLWRPAGVPQAPLIVICPNQLPTSAVVDTYDSAVQAFVSLGYTVLKVNVRGAAGFGLDAQQFATGVVATTLREDLEDAVQALVAQQVVDPHRVALFGRNMGGVQALQIAAASDRFAAVATLNVPAEVTRDNLLWMSEENSVNRLATQLGGWSQSAQTAKEISPVQVAPKVKVPALYLHNEDSIKGRPNEPGRKIRSAVEKAKVKARSDLAYSWTDKVKPPSQVAREDAGIVLKIAGFFDETMPARK